MLTLQATGTVDRYAHGVTAMRGMAGRRLTMTVSAHATTTPDVPWVTGSTVAGQGDIPISEVTTQAPQFQDDRVARLTSAFRAGLAG